MTGNVYNPNSPLTLGEEWFADLYGDQNLGTDGPWAQRIRSRSAETVNQVTAYLRQASNSLADLLLVEVIPAGLEIPSGAVTTSTFQPDADAVRVGFTNQAGSTANLWQSIDEGVAAADLTDYATYVASGDKYGPRFATAGFSATARVLKIEAAVSAKVTGLLSNMTFVLRHTPTSTDYPLTVSASIRSTGGDAPWLLTIDLGEINPRTKLPWTPADVIGFDTGTALYSIVGTANIIVGGALARIYAMELRVTWQAVENRVAAASYVKAAGSAVPDGGQTTPNFVALPAAGASWAKATATDYTFLLRLPRSMFAAAPVQTIGISVPWLSAKRGGVEGSAVVPGVVSARPTLDAYGQVTVCDFTTAQAGRTIPLVVTTTAPAVSQDSLPYFLQNDTTRLVGVNNAQTVTQLLTVPATSTFALVRFLASPGVATGALTVKIKRVSDDTQFGSTVTITAADARTLDDEGGGFRFVELTLASGAALVSATQYYLELSTTDATALGSGWRVIGLGSSSMAGGPATFGGTTDDLTVAGAAKTHQDLVATVTTVPDPPVGFTATVAELTLDAGAGNCRVPAVDVVDFGWTPSALGGTFLRYEVQRSEDGTVTWTTIGYGTSSEALSTWADQESARGVAAQYRIRVVRVDGIASAWSAPTPAIVAYAHGVEVFFCTNENPALAVAYNREPLREYTMLSAARDQILEIYGSDKAVAFMECEDPGISLPMTLTVNFATPLTVDEVAMWSPLRTIARAPVSYVCVLDPSGSRFYAHLQFPKGRTEEPGDRFHADVLITEIADTSSIAVF